MKYLLTILMLVFCEVHCGKLQVNDFYYHYGICDVVGSSDCIHWSIPPQNSLPNKKLINGLKQANGAVQLLKSYVINFNGNKISNDVYIGGSQQGYTYSWDNCALNDCIPSGLVVELQSDFVTIDVCNEEGICGRYDKIEYFFYSTTSNKEEDMPDMDIVFDLENGESVQAFSLLKFFNYDFKNITQNYLGTYDWAKFKIIIDRTNRNTSRYDKLTNTMYLKYEPDKRDHTQVPRVLVHEFSHHYFYTHGFEFNNPGMAHSFWEESTFDTKIRMPDGTETIFTEISYSKAFEEGLASYFAHLILNNSYLLRTAGVTFDQNSQAYKNPLAIDIESTTEWVVNGIYDEKHLAELNGDLHAIEGLTTASLWDIHDTGVESNIMGTGIGENVGDFQSDVLDALKNVKLERNTKKQGVKELCKEIMQLNPQSFNDIKSIFEAYQLCADVFGGNYEPNNLQQNYLKKTIIDLNQPGHLHIENSQGEKFGYVDNGITFESSYEGAEYRSYRSGMLYQDDGTGEKPDEWEPEIVLYDRDLGNLNLTINGIDAGSVEISVRQVEWNGEKYIENYSHVLTKNILENSSLIIPIDESVLNNPQDNEDPTKPGIPQLSVTAPGEVYIEWDPSSDNVGISHYSLEYKMGENSEYQVQAVASGTTYYQFQGLTENETYYFRVNAFDEYGNESGYSKNWIFLSEEPSTNSVPPTPPGQPNLKLINGKLDLEISWTASSDDVGVSGYKIFYAIDGNNEASLLASVSSNQTSYITPNFIGEDKYWFVIRTLDVEGNVVEGLSNFIIDPGAPYVTANIVQGPAIKIAWDFSEEYLNIKEYEIWVSFVGTTYQKLITLTEDVSEYDWNNFKENTDYTFKIKVIEYNDDVTESNEVELTTSSIPVLHHIPSFVTMEPEGTAIRKNLVIENSPYPNASYYKDGIELAYCNESDAPCKDSRYVLGGEWWIPLYFSGSGSYSYGASNIYGSSALSTINVTYVDPLDYPGDALINSISSQIVYPGQEVTIYGDNFGTHQDGVVYYADGYENAYSISNTMAKIKIPDQIQAGENSISFYIWEKYPHVDPAIRGSMVNLINITVTPLLSGLSDALAVRGQVVEIFGKGFGNTIENALINLNEVQLSPIYVSNEKIVARIPKNLELGTILVSVEIKGHKSLQEIPIKIIHNVVPTIISPLLLN